MCLKVLICVVLCLASIWHKVYSQDETPCPLDLSINIDDGTVLSNGSVLHNNIVYSENEYFVFNETEYRGCICLKKHCLKKCCPHGSTFGGDSTVCQPTDDPRMIPFNPPVYEDFEHLVDLNTSEHFTYMFGVDCNGGAKFPLNPIAYESDAFYLQYDGHLFVPEMGNYTPANFCMELFLDQPKTGIPWPDNNPQYLAILCFESPEQQDPSILYIIFPIGLLISSPFLLATFCVYAFIPELRNLHGKALMNYVFSLFFGFTSLAANQIISGRDIDISRQLCETLAFIIYFFFTLSFFWLNVMCIDIWLTFRGFKAPRIGRRSAEHRRFIFYCVYAWGCTLALTSICALMQYHPDIPNHIVKPNFAELKCWFEDRTRELFFFYIPVIILVVSNLFLFSNTSLKIVQINRETAMLQTGDSTRHDQYSKDKQRFNLYLKLFLVMGINWTAELLSFIIGGNQYIWIFSDCLNTILGVYIFFIFVCKKKIKNLIIKRYHLIRYGSTSTQTRSSSRFRTTTVGMSSMGETDKSFVSETSVIKLKAMN